jgi:threonine dehydrogenase-like Zn-dependent dehydrogenase
MNSTAVLPAATQASPTTMRAAVLVAPGQVECRHVAIPKPRASELRVRIEGCGVCASNIPPFEGREWFRYPMTPGQLGHEAWGVVDAIGGDVMHFSVGDRVAFLSDHAYAEYDVADETKAVALPDSLMEKPFPAEPLGCAINIFNRSQIKPTQTVAIVGIGFLGALLIQLAESVNARVIAVARRECAQQTAAEMGAAHVVPMNDHWRVIEEIRQLTGGHFCDVVIECTGKQWPLDLSAEITRERGRLVIAGYHQDGLRTCNMQLWNWRGLDVINAHERDPQIYVHGMTAAVDAVASGRLDPLPLYTHTFPLEKLGEALRMTRERPDGFMKALIKM